MTENQVIINYLSQKADEFESGLKHWVSASKSNYNDIERQKYCEENIIKMKAVYDELSSMIKNLELTSSQKFTF
jgi:hypothetical protein